MEKVVVRDLVIGEGRPKICLPIVETTEDEIIKEAERIRKSKLADLVEWRADYYEALFDETGKLNEDSFMRLLRDLRYALGRLPLLFTFRTKQEGGNKETKKLVYDNIVELAASTGYVDLVDIESIRRGERILRLIKRVKSHGVKVITSYHDFEKTPVSGELKLYLKRMEEQGADIRKIAVTPKDKDDVFSLLSISYELSSKEAKSPIVAISMGKEGSISRLVGEFFGSAITYGCMKKTSAPGQIDAFKLQAMLQIIHESLT